jgi:2-polyprenyl-6-methoxyphenol hydroxylase-like FAD-dependent oxidoreductase
MRAGVLQLSRWGLLDRVVVAGTPAIRSTSFHYADGSIARVATHPTAGVDALYAPRRYLFDRLLLDAAAQAGVDVFTETAVTALRRDETGRVRVVRSVDRSGRTVELPASMTVGADGIRSTVAALVRAPVIRQGRSRSAVLYRYVAGVPADGYQWAYGAGAGLIPTNDGQTCVSSAPHQNVCAGCGATASSTLSPSCWLKPPPRHCATRSSRPRRQGRSVGGAEYLDTCAVAGARGGH